MFAIQRRTIEIGAPEDLTLGRREVERRQKVRRGGETLDVRKMTQHLGEAVRHMNKLRKEKKKKKEREIDLCSGHNWWKDMYEQISWRSDQVSSEAWASGPRRVFKACDDASLVMIKENGQVTMVVSSSSLGASTDMPNGPVDGDQKAVAHSRKRAGP